MECINVLDLYTLLQYWLLFFFATHSQRYSIVICYYYSLHILYFAALMFELYLDILILFHLTDII